MLEIYERHVELDDFQCLNFIIHNYANLTVLHREYP